MKSASLLLLTFSNGELISLLSILATMISGFCLFGIRSGKILTIINDIKPKVDRLEMRLNDVEVKVNTMWKKFDHFETKLNNVEANVNLMWKKFDLFESKFNDVEAKVNVMRKKFDLFETKFNDVEVKVNLMWKKFDHFETKLNDVEAKVNLMWTSTISQSKSPRELNEKGKKLVHDAQIDVLLDGIYDELLLLVKNEDVSNNYRIEQAVVKTVRSLPDLHAEWIPNLENSAFNCGVSIDIILMAGALFIRDRIINDLNTPSNDVNYSGSNFNG